MSGKKRQAVWRECPYCKIRGILPPFRSGKLKCLEKHAVECEATMHLENQCTERPKIDTILAMVRRQQKQIAELSARCLVLENRKSRVRTSESPFLKMSPKDAWGSRKWNAVRLFEHFLMKYPGPCRYYKTKWEYFSWNFPACTHLASALQAGLWPVLEMRGDKCALRNIETVDLYFIAKQIWGRSKTVGLDGAWYFEALQEIGVPPDYLKGCQTSVKEGFAHLELAVARFQNTSNRKPGEGICQGLVKLHRIWTHVYALEEADFTDAIRQPPQTRLTLET